MKQGLILGIIVSLIFVCGSLIFNWMDAVSQEAQTEPETQWAWGEVLSLDAQNKTFVLKFLDYETDEEKDLSILVDDKTTYENIKSIEEIKPKDILSVDYITSPEGKNIARDISLEELEDAPTSETETAPQATPTEVQPAAGEE